MYVADLLSRSYIQDPVEDEKEIMEIVHSLSKNLQISEGKKSVFRKHTEIDPVLYQIKFCKEGWPKCKKMVPENLKFYFKLRTELCVKDGIIFLNNKVVVPYNLRKDLLQLLHEPHFGMKKKQKRELDNFYIGQE